MNSNLSYYTTMKREWSVDQEIKLFSLVCDYKPAGEKKHENIAQIVVHINKDNLEPFTPEMIWEKLAQYYDLEKVDEIENEEDDEESSRVESAKMQIMEPRTQPKEEHDQVKMEEHHDIAIDSSELSDVEGDEAELAKLEGEPLLPVEEIHKKGRRKSTPRRAEDAISEENKKLDETRDIEKEGDSDRVEKEEPALRKRTRQVAKLDTAESTQKRRLLRASTPPTTKRRTRSELVPQEDNVGEDNENEEEEPEPKTKRSIRKAPRRSVRKR